MIAQPSTARRICAGIAAVSATVVLAGCAAGQRAHTAEQTPVVDGVSTEVGSINLRAVTVAAPEDRSYPQGGDAQLRLYLVNSGTQDDKLVGVTTSQAGAVEFFPSAAAAALQQTGTPGGAESSTPAGSGSAASSRPSTPGESASPSESATPSESPTPSASTSSGTSPSTIESIDIPAGKSVPIGYRDSDNVIVLRGLTGQLFPAQSFKITFTFATAGSVMFTVAVHLASGPPTTPTEDIKPTAEG